MLFAACRRAIPGRNQSQCRAATLAFNNMSGIGRARNWDLEGGSSGRLNSDKTGPFLITPVDETFDIGADSRTPVDGNDYQVPFMFTGKIDKLTISVEPPKLTPEDVNKLKAANRATQDAN
jgi:hypothetical protein